MGLREEKPQPSEAPRRRGALPSLDPPVPQPVQRLLAEQALGVPVCVPVLVLWEGQAACGRLKETNNSDIIRKESSVTGDKNHKPRIAGS